MAELYIIGEVVNAINFIEPNLFCKWSIQSGELIKMFYRKLSLRNHQHFLGSTWKNIEGAAEGKTTTNTNRLENGSTFAQPIDLHLACRGIQGWPKIHLEVCAVNALKQYWPVGLGFAYIPTQPGYHKIKIHTWKIAATTYLDVIKEKFHGGGLTISKSDIIYSGVDRYKLCTKSSGLVIVELMLIFKNFEKFGVELQNRNH